MIIFSSQPPLVCGDNSFASVSIPSGTSVPGCENTSSCFAPSKVAIAQGGQVTWSNDDSAAHTVTSGTPSEGFDGHFDSGLLLAGSTFSVSLDDSGTYPYLCMVHPWMKGTIIVDGSEPEPAPEPEPIPEISVYTIKSSYSEGDVINITGKIWPLMPYEIITIQVFANGNQIDIAQVGTSGNVFTHTILAKGPLWQVDGTYTVRALYSTAVAETYFQFTTMAPPTPEPEPEVVEETEHEPEPEPEVPPPAPTGTDVIIGLGTAVPGCEDTNECFSPSTFSIDSGEYVIWYNADTAYHTVISGDPADANSVGAVFDSGLFGPGEAYDYQFNQSGTFPYWCIVHPWMKGTIIVEDTEPEPEVMEEPEPEVIPEPSVESSYATIYVQLTKSYYNTGDIIMIYGAVSKNIGGTVSIFVTAPNDNLIVVQQVKVDSANNFAIEVQTGSINWDTSGTYTVKAQYGTSIDEVFFQYQANKLTPKSTSEYSPTIIPVPTPDVPAPQDDGLEQLIEDNKILREELKRQGEEIDELNQEVDYLKNIIESIQGFFGSIFG